MILFVTLTLFLSPNSLTTWKAPLLAPGQLLFDGQLWSVTADNQVDHRYNQTLLGGLKLGLARYLQLNLTSFYEGGSPALETEAENVEKDRMLNLHGSLLFRPRNDLELALSFEQTDDKFDSTSVHANRSTTRFYREFALRGHWFSHNPSDPDSLPYDQSAFSHPLLDSGHWRLSSGLSLIRRSYRSESSYIDSDYDSQSEHLIESNYWQLSLGAGVSPLPKVQLEADLYFSIPFTQTDVQRDIIRSQHREWNGDLKYAQLFSYRLKGTCLPTPWIMLSAEYRHYKTKTIAEQYGDYTQSNQLHSFLFGGSIVSMSTRRIPLKASIDTLSGPLLDKNQIKLDIMVKLHSPEFLSSFKNWMVQSRVSVGLLQNLQVRATWEQVFYEEPMAHGQYEFQSKTRFAFDLTARVGSRLELFGILKPIAPDRFHPSFLNNDYWRDLFVSDPENWLNPEKTSFSLGFRLFL